MNLNATKYFVVSAILALLPGCNTTAPFSGAASMRVDISVYKGPLSNSESVQQGQLQSILFSAPQSIDAIDLQIEQSMCRVGCVTADGALARNSSVPTYSRCSQLRIPQRSIVVPRKKKFSKGKSGETSDYPETHKCQYRQEHNIGVPSWECSDASSKDRYNETSYYPATNTCSFVKKGNGSQAVWTCEEAVDRIVYNSKNFTTLSGRFPDYRNANYRVCPFFERTRRQLKNLKYSAEMSRIERITDRLNRPVSDTVLNALTELAGPPRSQLNASAFCSERSAAELAGGPANCVNLVEQANRASRSVRRASQQASQHIRYHNRDGAVSAATLSFLETAKATLKSAEADASKALSGFKALSAPLSVQKEIDTLAIGLAAYTESFQVFTDNPVAMDVAELEKLIAAYFSEGGLSEPQKEQLVVQVTNFLAGFRRIETPLGERLANVRGHWADLDAARTGNTGLSSYLVTKNISAPVARDMKTRIDRLTPALQSLETIVARFEAQTPTQLAGGGAEEFVKALKDARLYNSNPVDSLINRLGKANLDLKFSNLALETFRLRGAIAKDTSSPQETAERNKLLAAQGSLEQQQRKLSATAKFLEDIALSERSIKNERDQIAYREIARLAGDFRLVATSISYQLASVDPPSTRLRIDLLKTANMAADYANQLSSRANALSLQSGGLNRRLISTGQYLRDTQPTDFIETFDWLDAFSSGATTPVRERINISKRLFDDDNWAQINEVHASGAGDVSIALIRSDIGNWTIKSFGNDPTDLTRGYAELGGELIEKAIELAGSGGASVATDQIKSLVDTAQDVQTGTKVSKEAAAGDLISKLNLDSVRSGLVKELEQISTELAAELDAGKLREKATENVKSRLETAAQESFDPAANTSQIDAEVLLLTSAAQAKAQTSALRVKTRYKDLITALQEVVIAGDEKESS